MQYVGGKYVPSSERRMAVHLYFEQDFSIPRAVEPVPQFQPQPASADEQDPAEDNTPTVRSRGLSPAFFFTYSQGGGECSNDESCVEPNSSTATEGLSSSLSIARVPVRIFHRS